MIRKIIHSPQALIGLAMMLIVFLVMVYKKVTTYISKKALDEKEKIAVENAVPLLKTLQPNK